MSHRRNPKKYKGVTRHEKPTRAMAKPASPDLAWRLRKVLRALADGGRLAYDKLHHKWHCLRASGKRLTVKRNLVLELLRCKFIDFRLRLSNWGRFASQAAL